MIESLIAIFVTWFAASTVIIPLIEVLLCVMCVGAYRDKSPGWSGFFLGIAGTIIYFRHFNDYSKYAVLIGAAIYIGIGIVYSLFKWRQHVKQIYTDLSSSTDERDKQSFIEMKKMLETHSIADSIKCYNYGTPGWSSAQYLVLSNNTSKFYEWIVLWAFSLLFNIWLEFIPTIQKTFSSIYNSITRRIFGV